MGRGKKTRRVRSDPATEVEKAPEADKADKGSRADAAPGRGGAQPGVVPSETHRSKAVGLIVTVALALALALAIQAFVVKPFQVPTGSMEPTLDPGQRILANRFIYRFEDPSIGDIIVFHPPADRSCGVQPEPGEACSMPVDGESSEYYVKRIVAGPGDRFSVRDGHPVVNGVEKVDEPYIRPCGSGTPCNLPKTITIPPDHYFVMGDNRGGSFDSRFWGPVPRDSIIGEAFATYWPPSRFGFL